MIATTRQQALTAPGELVLGYARIGDGDPLHLAKDTTGITAFAREHSLSLGTIFTDRNSMVPAIKRPGLRALLDVVRFLPPGGVVVPTVWHLAQSEQELSSLLRQFARYRCRIFMAHAAATGFVMPRHVLGGTA